MTKESKDRSDALKFILRNLSLWELHADFAILDSPSTMDLEKNTREEFELVGPGLLSKHGSKQDQ